MQTVCASEILDLSFHSKLEIYAVGLLCGRVELFKYLRGQPSDLKMSLTHHSLSRRTVNFCRSGDILYTASSDNCICALSTTGHIVSGA